MSSLTLADHREQAFGNLPEAAPLHHGQLGKTQRSGHCRIRDALHCSAIRQIHKRELRDSFGANAQGH